MSISARQALVGEIQERQSLCGEVNVGDAIEKKPEYYEGECEITPTEEKQVLSTSQKLVKEDIIIKPIPQNYGRITYNQDKTITIT